MRTTCPHCDTPLTIPDKYAGRSGKCRTCGGVIAIPTAIPAIRAQPPQLRRRARGVPGVLVLVLILAAAAGGFFAGREHMKQQIKSHWNEIVYPKLLRPSKWEE